MKKLFTIAAVLLSTTMFAGNGNNNENTNITDSERAAVINNLAGLIGNETVLNELGVNGQANVTVSVDENGVMHVETVQTNDFVLEYHIRQSIEGVKMIVSDSLVGKTVSFIMNVVQTK